MAALGECPKILPPTRCYVPGEQLIWRRHPMPKTGDMAPAVDLMDKLHQQLMTVRARLQHHGDDRGKELMDAAFQTLAELRGSDGGHRSSSACRSTSLPSRMPVVPEAMCALDMRKDKVSHTLDLLLECTWLFEAHAIWSR